MLDAKILAASIASREAYERVKGHITDKDMTPPIAFWWGLLEDWYVRDPKASGVDRELLMEQASSRLALSKHKDALLSVIRNLPDAPSPVNTAQVALELRRYNVGMELGAAIAGGDQKKVRELWDSFGKLLAATELHIAKWERALDWADLDTIVGDDKRIPVAPRRLNDRLRGGALPGHSILVVGRPEAGKSTFAINATAGFLGTGQRVLYFGNEDGINILKARVRNRLANMTPDEVKADPAKANALAAERAGDRLQMIHLHPGGTRDMIPFVEEFQPTVIIVDQLRNLSAKGDSKTNRLEQAAQDIRDLNATYGLVSLSITQQYAGEHDKHGKVYVEMDDTDSSRTGIPGAVDLFVGIGYDADMLIRNQRMLNLPKNKMSSDDGSKDPILVDIDKKRAKYT